MNHELKPGAMLSRNALYFVNEPDVDLSNCKGQGVNGIGAKLPRAKFVGADLRSALLCHCDLRAADFTNADLTDANFHGSDATDAKFTGARGVATVVWDDVIGKP